MNQDSGDRQDGTSNPTLYDRVKRARCEGHERRFWDQSRSLKSSRALLNAEGERWPILRTFTIGSGEAGGKVGMRKRGERLRYVSRKQKAKKTKTKKKGL